MSISEIAAIEEDEDTQELSPSEETYLRFRQTVEPGLFEAGFDLLPGKSEAFKDKKTGERFVDQQLRTHIINGAAFGARLNRALRELNATAALSQTELMEVLSLYAAHDFHKSEIAQLRRRRWEHHRQDEDKDISKEEAEYFVHQLRLNKLETEEGETLDLEINDWWKSALAAEKGSGRHDTVASRAFRQYKEWIRLLDAAAGLSDPGDVDRLTSRLAEISPDVELHYHRLNDTKGLATNLLNTTISDRISSNGGVSLVYFENGALYLTSADSEGGLNLLSTDSEDTPQQLSDEFIETIRTANPTLTEIDTVRNLLDDSAYRFGYYKITPLTYLFAGVERAFEAVQRELVARADRDPNQYTVYEDGLLVALGTGIVDSVPASHVKPQLLGVYIATALHQLFTEELDDGDRLEGLKDTAAALDLEQSGEILQRLHKQSDTDVESVPLAEENYTIISDNFEMTEDEVAAAVRDVTVGGGKKTESMALALAYLSEETDEGVPRSELPLLDVLEQAHSDIFEYYREWQSHWDEGHDRWDPDQSVENKRTAFERTLRGNLQHALPHYIRRYVSVDGQCFDRPPSEKFEAYNRSTQARICLTCNDELVGKRNALNAFTTNESIVGRSLTFTHLKTLDPSNSREVKSVVCAMCELEFNLRNAAQSTYTDDQSLYLFTAPDYFHSPVDVRIQDWLHREVSGQGSEGFYATARAIIGGNPSNRSELVRDVLEALTRDAGARETLLNYDNQYNDSGSLGIFRLDRPSRPDRDTNINRISHWTAAVFAAHVFGWLTGSRVILSDSPFPSLNHTDTTAMVTCEGVPAQVDRELPTTSSISMLWDVETYSGRDHFDIHRPLAADDTDSVEALDTEELSPALASEVPDEGALHLSTELGSALYRLGAMLYVTNRAHGVDLQRLSTVLSRLSKPFPGGSTVLKEADDAPLEDYSALFAATTLDTLTHPDMSNSITRLAKAGFEVVHPDRRQAESPSNYEYERLFRAAREALNETLARNADPDELKDIVAGVVMETGTRARESSASSEKDRKYADSKYTREPAEEFAEIFVNDIYLGLCDGEFYELRRMENSLASGYNVAIRRHQQEWFDEYNDGE